MDDAEFLRWYGPWRSPAPAEVAHILAGLAVPWWVAGGWAIEAFSGVARAHEDTDIAVFRDDLPAVLRHLLPAYCVWSATSGALRPLRAPDELPAGSRQLWVRRDATSPWLLDILLTPHDGDTWISVRDEHIRRPLAEAVWIRDGLRYLRPEIVLHLKAKHSRSKDHADFRATCPHLDAEARHWLHASLTRTNPGHPWLEQVAPTSGGNQA